MSQIPEEIKELLPKDLLLIPQRGESLGDRLHNAMEDLFFEGFGSICLMGSDSPTPPPSYVGQAVEYLRRPEDSVVIGPTVDGGYYFIGLKAACLRLLEEIDWGTDRVFEQTRMRVAELGMAQMILRSGMTSTMELHWRGYWRRFARKNAKRERTLRIAPPIRNVC
jgi:glycosyltransferase A (GT-A) superfamily protein (DUF2064 family)